VRDENRRSLGYARDDKKERAVVEKERLLKERLIVRAGRPLSFSNRPVQSNRPFLLQPLFLYYSPLLFVIPTRISSHAALDMVACAPFS
jgi:hypothetical protein